MSFVRYSTVRLICLLGLAACGVPGGRGTASPRPPITPTFDVEKTTIVTPNEVQTPTSAAPTDSLPTPVPFRLLARPVLLYGMPVDESGGFGYRFEDAVGHRGDLPGLVTDWPTTPLADALSPNHEWLAYESHQDDQPQAAYLGLYDLTGATTSVRLPLIADSFELDLSRVSEYLVEQYGPDGIEAAVDLTTFQQCVGNASWSPQGRYVAYVSQYPGPSPDVVIYDTQTSMSRRVTNDGGIACSVDWSPDGAWLLYTTVVPGINRPRVEFHRVRADVMGGSESEALLDGYWWVGLDWLGPYSYAVMGTSDGGPYHDLQVIDLQAGTATNIWAKPIEAVAVDPRSGLIVVSTAEPDSATGDGLFLVYPGGETQRVDNRPYWSVWVWGQPHQAFVANNGKALVSISDAGQLSALFALPTQWESVTRMVVAPDGTAMAVFNDGGEGLYLVNGSGRESRKLGTVWPTAVIWRPDGLELVYLEGNTLVSMDPGTGQGSVIFDCTNGSSMCVLDGNDVVWIP